jgi:hypothetical protein
MPAAVNERLVERLETLDSLRLLEEIRQSQHQLVSLDAVVVAKYQPDQAGSVNLYGVCIASNTSLSGERLGPLAVGLLTEHLLHDRAAVGLSLRIVAPGAFLLAAIILARGLATLSCRDESIWGSS